MSHLLRQRVHQNLCAVLQERSTELPENGPFLSHEPNWRGPQSRKTIQKTVAIATMTTTIIAVVVIILLLKPEGKYHFPVAIWNASPVLGTQSH